MDVSSISHHECVILLTGAPLPGMVDFGSSENLVERYLPPFRRFLDVHDQSSDKNVQDATTSLSHAKSKTANWRFIPTLGNLLPSLNEQTQSLDTNAIPNLPLAGLPRSGNVDLSENYMADSPYKDFYESSYIWHTNVNCSQGKSSEGALDYTYPGENIILKALQNQQLHIVPLSGLPSAGDVDRLVPQTVTASFLVAAVKVDFKCQIRARRTGQLLDLVEVLVGDDTRNAFNINIWHKSSAPFSKRSTGTVQYPSAMDNPRSIMNNVKIGDLLLLENIALATWKGCLYGQNLRKRIGNIETKIHIVDRKQIDASSSSNIATRIAKITNWAMEHVGSVGNYVNGTENESPFLAHIPPDTQ